MVRPIAIFCSYAHEDEALVDALKGHLAVYDRQHVISWWHDREIPAGREFPGEIDQRLHTADIVLLCASADFFRSDYCWDVEMAQAMRRHAAGHARVIPIILRPCSWKDAPFARLAVLPTDGKPVTSWSDRDQACLTVTEGIMKVVGELAHAPAAAPGAGGAVTAAAPAVVHDLANALPGVQCNSPLCRSPHVALSDAVQISELTADAGGWIARGTLQVEYRVEGQCQTCGRIFEVARRAIPVQFPDLVCNTCGQGAHLQYRIKHLTRVATGWEFAVEIRCSACEGSLVVSRVVRSLLSTFGLRVGLGIRSAEPA